MLQRVQDFVQQDKPLIFSYIVGREIFDGQTRIPGIDFPDRRQPSRHGKKNICKAQYLPHLSRVQWRIMEVDFR